MKIFSNSTLVIFLLLFTQLLHSKEVNLYSARKEALIQPLLMDFQKETGIKVHLLTGKADALLARLKVEGKLTPADLFITVDIARLWRAKKSGVLQPLTQKKWMRSIPNALRQDHNYWLPLSLRARPIIYDATQVDTQHLSRYEDLAHPRWKGKLCLRSSNSVYNQSLVASSIYHIGEAKTLSWIKGMVSNLVAQPSGGDTDQIKSVISGVCQLTLANTYYLGRLYQNPKFKDKLTNIRVFWPNQSNEGAHFNISGVAMTRYAKNIEASYALLKFLLSPKAQKWYAEVNNEYPVLKNIPITSRLDNLGKGKVDYEGMSNVGKHTQQAIQLMNKGKWY